MRPLAFLAALLLASVVAAPAQAATLHRTFVARVGSDGANGTTRIEAYTDGTGRQAFALKGLRRGATYRVEVRRGRCGNLGTVVTRLPDVRTSSRGTVAATRSVSATKMNAVWMANWTNRLAIRLVSGSSIRCGNLNFTSASRVRMPAQGVLNAGIDLEVVRGPSGYPYCNTAMYMGALSQPTEPGVTFIYAHARTGMFLPLLNQWNRNQGVRMIGLKVYVYTTNNRMHTYVIERVWRSKQMDGATKPQEKLWLQTSTGPNFTYPKLFLEARRVGSVSVSHAAAHPTVRYTRCG